MKVRAGLGYDIHCLKRGRKLFLGGIEIPFPKGLAGHSDGDCLIHSIIDALLGAMGEKDIGQLFPDSDKKYKDIRSTELLSDVLARLRARGMEIVNCDSVIVAEEPRIAPHILRMKKFLSSFLGVNKENLGIKAKTNEGLGLIGEGKAIACWALVILGEKEKRKRRNEKVQP